MADERMSEEEIADLATLADGSAGSPQAYLAHALRRAVAELRRERARADAFAEAVKIEHAMRLGDKDEAEGAIRYERARADAAERRIAEALVAIPSDDDVVRIQSDAAKREREVCVARLRAIPLGDMRAVGMQADEYHEAERELFIAVAEGRDHG